MFNKIEKESILGTLYAKDGSEFTVIQVNNIHGKRVAKLQRKLSIPVSKMILVKSINATMEPYEIMTIPLDLTKSSMQTNKALIDYLYYPSHVNTLLEKSSASSALIRDILSESYYNIDSIKETIARTQNVFDDDSLIRLLGFPNDLILLTENPYRTIENMGKLLELYNNCIYKLIVLLDEPTCKINVRENPSTIRVNIINTNIDFYDGKLVFNKERENAVNILKLKLKELTVKQKMLAELSLLVGMYEFNSPELKEAAMKLIGENNVDDQIENQLSSISIAESFPY